MPHLFVDISSHGFGHLAQTAPVVNALRARLPKLTLTVRCGLPRERLEQRITGAFVHVQNSSDFGMLMQDAVAVDTSASCARYTDFHADWEARVAAEAAWIARLAPDLVLANVSYLALAGAARAGLPAYALCSLNWAEIFYPYCGDDVRAAAIRAQMCAAYASARAFLRPTPGMAMPGLTNVRDIGPIGRAGTNRRDALLARCGLAADTRLVLVAMGGIAQPLDSARWPHQTGLHWIAPQKSGLKRADVIALEALPYDITDLIASCDAVLTKSGYGTFVEAAAAATRVLYVSRPDWPEEPCLAQWLHTHGRARPITRTQLAAGSFLPDLLDLLGTPRAAPVALTGIAAAADWLAQAIDGGIA